MSTATRVLADRIEDSIRERTARRVDEALAQAREVAFRAYADSLRASCGRPFEVVVGEVMAAAEKSLRAQAIAAGERIETDEILRRLEAAQPLESSACSR